MLNHVVVRTVLVLSGLLVAVRTVSAQDEAKIKKGERQVGSPGGIEAGRVSDDGKQLTINGTGKTVAHACTAEAPVKIVINGTQHRVMLTGDCEQVTVNGTSHTVAIEG